MFTTIVPHGVMLTGGIASLETAAFKALRPRNIRDDGEILTFKKAPSVLIFCHLQHYVNLGLSNQDYFS